MKKFEILIIEEERGIYEVEGDTFLEACLELENKIESGEIILQNTDTYERIYKNNNSKLLTEKIDMRITYNPSINEITIFHNDNKITDCDNCYTVRDFSDAIQKYCDDNLENMEITMNSLEKEL